MKMYNVVSKEAVKKMNGVRGKLLTQGQHGILHSFWDAEARFPEQAAEYKNSEHARKINVSVETDEELQELRDRYAAVCGVSLVKDAGFTVFKEPTITCLGIGPIREEDIGEDLRSLPLFK